MVPNKVMRLWTAVVAAFLALCTALGLITTTASAAVPQAEPACNPAPAVTVPTAPSEASSHSGALPPTMKQRIRAEAHGGSPSCRLHRHTDTLTSTTRDAVVNTARTPRHLAERTETLSPAHTPVSRE
ncbi:DUF6344 domain-containing protein [Streptomyces poonensis]|uniref:Secreted protein n=1 Tax=Streptomyces poonensis TaxID=68255 RepID=A0A918UIF2_9ACTN|nr:DUF6344 domain-containing protein [Streptomyces poonensis]GGZ12153.1 hypothetical protein GCM10010365_34730 [Streptomyces poonensis]GLJ93750.1 hypothetical protein GCM10017589_63660 [Streptomyces poonensis]